MIFNMKMKEGDSEKDQINSSLSDYECKIYDDDSFTFSPLTSSIENYVDSSKIEKKTPLCSTKIEDKGDAVVFDETFQTESIELSPYEEWLMKKMKQATEEKKKEKMKLKESFEEKRIDEKHKENIRNARIKSYKSWLKSKELKIKAEIARKKLIEEEKEKEILHEKEMKRIKSMGNYEKWLEKDKKKCEKLKQKQKKDEEVEKKQKELKVKENEEKFRLWLEEKKKQKFKVPDRDNPPKPGYINPTPWVSPIIIKPDKPISKPKPPKVFPVSVRLYKPPSTTRSLKQVNKKKIASTSLLRPFSAPLNTTHTINPKRLKFKV